MGTALDDQARRRAKLSVAVGGEHEAKPKDVRSDPQAVHTNGSAPSGQCCADDAVPQLTFNDDADDLTTAATAR